MHAVRPPKPSGSRQTVYVVKGKARLHTSQTAARTPSTTTIRERDIGASACRKRIGEGGKHFGKIPTVFLFEREEKRNV